MSDELERQIEDLRGQIEKLTEIKRLLDDPESRAILAKELAVGRPATRRNMAKKRRQSVSGGVTAFDRLKAWFADRNAEPATITEMSEAAGVGVSAIRQILYTTRQDEFVKVGVRKGTRESIFQPKT